MGFLLWIDIPPFMSRMCRWEEGEGKGNQLIKGNKGGRNRILK
jgi:hypothetical protein